ncbi:MAG: N-acetyl-gamma-glutamyl-phosphate reductase [Acidobacteriia bacterium]|nr:N-acetyl-gamma-glutamyl-phosphate reductase [Terriglobia bacterium]
MSAELQSAVVGATGYSGQELTRILFQHPRMRPPLLLARESDNGSATAEIISPVDGTTVPIHPFSWRLLHQRGVDLLFLATPHEVSRAWVPEAMERGLRVIDLSGAWRLRTHQYAAVYGFKDIGSPASEAVMDKALYGLPELCRAQLPDAQLVANPGCYPTSAILALAPLIEAGLLDVEHGVVCDSKSGVSGAGKSPTAETHFVETAENFRAYSAFTHRHAGEILEQLQLAPEQLTFSTHLLPIRRGILSSIYAHLKRVVTASELEELIRDFYASSPFVRIFAPPRLPEVQHSQHSNFCDIGWVLAPDGKRVMLVSCLDNLIKGAAGQAVQSMNLMYGWDEREGLIPVPATRSRFPRAAYVAAATQASYVAGTVH